MLMLADRPWEEVEEIQKTFGTEAARSGLLNQIPPRRYVVRNLLESERSFITKPVKTKELKDLTGTTSMGGWSGSDPWLTGAHHVFPKSALSWLFDHMTEVQRDQLRMSLYLPREAGAQALARLKSNVISSYYNERTLVRPEERKKDPHHHPELSEKGEEYLDLVRTRQGGYDPRSFILKQLAEFVIRQIYPRYVQEGRSENFKLSEYEAGWIIECLERAQMVHYAIAPDPKRPSHHLTGIWVQDEERRYVKTEIPSPNVPRLEFMSANYRLAGLLEQQAEERELAILARSRRRAEAQQTMSTQLQMDIFSAAEGVCRNYDLLYDKTTPEQVKRAQTELEHDYESARRRANEKWRLDKYPYTAWTYLPNVKATKCQVIGTDTKRGILTLAVDLQVEARDQMPTRTTTIYWLAKTSDRPIDEKVRLAKESLAKAKKY